MIKISYIIPCYNAEKYIKRCLDSLYHQDIPVSDFEVICVNDRSPDNMVDIIQSYQTDYPNLQLIQHEVNKGQSAARNNGLQYAKGEYVWFVDSDDYLIENSVRDLLEICKTNQTDITLFNISPDFVNYPFLEQVTPVTGMAYLNKWMSDSDCTRYLAMNCVWNHIFRREFLLNNNLYFDEKMKMQEDLIYSYKTFIFAERIIAVPVAVYINEYNPVSVSRRKLKAMNIYTGTFGMISNLLDLARLVGEQNKLVSENLLRGDAYFHILEIKYYYGKMALSEKIKYVQLIKSNSTERKQILRSFPELAFIDRVVLKFPVVIYFIGDFVRLKRSIIKRLKRKI